MSVERVALGSYPTPVERVERIHDRLWVKRDDLTSPIYGGNKVRKLELFFAAARQQGKTRLLTLGAAGSHQVLATALFGAQNGFEVEAVLVPQPASEHGRENLRAALAYGLHATPSPLWATAPPLVLARTAKDVFYIPLGGSNALGATAFVDAGRELAAQVRAGQMPEPDVVVVALGSGGTAAGLAVAFEEVGMKTRVVGVAVSSPTFALAITARRLAKQAAAMVGLTRDAGVRASGRLEITGEFIGRGYAWPTDAGTAAIAAGKEAGLRLDATYTAKAFACALTRKEPVVLFWQTLSSAPSRALPNETELPPKLARLFR